MYKKIAIVHDMLVKLGGAEKLLILLLKIFPDASIYTLFYDLEGTKSEFRSFKVHPSILQKDPTVAPTNYKLKIRTFPRAIESFKFDQYDLVISLSNSFAHGVKTNKHTTHLCYLLSPTRYLYDWSNEYLDENGLDKGPKSVVIRNLFLKLRVWDQLAANRPDRYLCISDHVKQRLNKYYRITGDVVYPGLDIKPLGRTISKSDYYLIVSRLSPYKKIDLAINAFKINRRPLLIIGEGDDKNRLMHIANDSKNIEFLNWQSESSLREYYMAAKALIFPGEEDFGYTPIEALSFGTPVIAFRKGGVTETIRPNIDGVLFSEATVNSLNDAVGKYEKMSSIFHPNRLHQRAEQFSFDIFKHQFQTALNNLKNAK